MEPMGFEPTTSCMPCTHIKMLYLRKSLVLKYLRKPPITAETAKYP